MSHVWYCNQHGFDIEPYRFKLGEPDDLDEDDAETICCDEEVEPKDGWSDVTCTACGYPCVWVPAPPEEPTDDDVMAELDELAGPNAPSYGRYMSIAEPIAFSVAKGEIWSRMKEEYMHETGISL